MLDWGKTSNIPFKSSPKEIFTAQEADRDDSQSVFSNWIDGIKQKARQNLDDGWERARIEYTARFKIPRYNSFDLYTPEEALLELWEQHYWENPDSLDLKGIIKKADEKTGYFYYQTGDPLIDELEEAFGRGEVPDMEKAFAHIKDGPDIFEMETFQTQKGQAIAARTRFEGMQTNEKGETITAAGTKVKHCDYSSEEWMKNALDEDPVLKKMAEKMGG